MPAKSPSLAAICFWISLCTAPIPLLAQAPPSSAPQDARPCKVVKHKQGQTQTSDCATSVFVTVPVPAPLPAPPPPPSRNIAGWISAIASCCSAIIAALIGWLAYQLNQSIRRGQMAHDQMRMLLEIDTELIAHPELWAVHGDSFKKTVEDAKGIEQKLKDYQAAKPEGKNNAALALADSLSASSEDGTMEDLRKLAFVSRYFNFFDILYANHGKKQFGGEDPGKSEEWKAWRSYIKNFLTGNAYAKGKWENFKKDKIYTKDFENFIDEIAKPAETPQTPAAPPSAPSNPKR